MYLFVCNRNLNAIQKYVLFSLSLLGHNFEEIQNNKSHFNETGIFKVYLISFDAFSSVFRFFRNLTHCMKYMLVYTLL